MKVQKFDDPKTYPFSLNPKKEETILYIWAEDGWLYIPQKAIRRKYITTGTLDVFEILDESWTGTIPLCEHMEKIHVTIYSESPQIWLEDSVYFSELYVELTSTENKSK